MKRTIAIVLAALAAHELLARTLDHFDLIERLLSPSADALVALPFAAILFVLRLALVFVAPAAVSLALAKSLRTGSW